MLTKIASIHDIPLGIIKSFTAGDKKIAIANIDDVFYAVNDECTHEQCSLGDGTVDEERVLTCACHGARFDVATGKVLALPAMRDVATYPLKQEGDDLYVDL